MPSALGDDPHRKPVLRVGACKTVLDKEVLPLEPRFHAIVEGAKLIRLNRSIYRPPPHMLLAGGLAHQKLVIRGPARVLARQAHERTALSHDSFVAAKGFLVQRCRS